MRAAPLLFFLPLIGCPFVFGPPELFEPLPGDDDPPQGNDTAPPSDDTEPPSIDTAGPVPVVIDLTATLLFDSVALRFQVIDGDGDLDGGRVLWRLGANDPVEVDLGDGLETWDGRTGSLRVPGIVRDCEETSPQILDYELKVADRLGNESPPATAQLRIALVEVASGEDRPTPLGVVAAPAVLCGTIEGGELRDRWIFETTPGGPSAISLEHEQERESNFVLRDDGGTVVAASTSPTSPKTEEAALTANTAYDMEISRPNTSGGAMAYVVTLHGPQ